MKKRLLAFIVAMIIVSVSGLSIYAQAKGITNWNVEYFGSEKDDGVTRFVKCDDEFSYSQNQSLHVKYATSDYGNNWIVISNSNVNSHDSTKQYALSFYLYEKDFSYNSADAWCNVKASMGWKAGENVKMLKNAQHFTVTDTAKAGWKKYETVLSGSQANFGLVFQYGCDIYIDDISFAPVGETDLILNGGFESDVIPKDNAPDATAQPLDENNWSVVPTGKAIDTSSVYCVSSSEEIYAGEKSLHIKYNVETESDPMGYGKNWIMINNFSATKKIKPNAQYTLSFYLCQKEKFPGWLNVFVGSGYVGGKSRLNIIDHFTVTPTRKPNWNKYTATMTTDATGTPFLQIGVQARCDIFIDNISLIDDMQNEIIGNGDFEAAKLDPSELLPDLTQKTLDSAHWNVVPNGESLESTNSYVCSSATSSYSGKRSMHIKYSASDYDNNWVTVQNIDVGNVIEQNAKYTVSFYMYENKPILPNALMYIGMGWNQTLGGSRLLFKNHFTITPTQKPGWNKYEATISADEKFFNIGIQANSDVYIDDISLAKENGTNLIANGDFEIDSTTPFDVSTVRLFDGKNEITTIQGNKTLTLATTVTNNNMAENLKAQLIVGLYNGGVLEKLTVSNVVSLSKNDGVETLVVNLDIPELPIGNKYSLRAFVWDGLDTMNPLANESAF